ncbi:MAG: type III pantothenate kinase [Bacteroidetes bacterium]|nr:MAG: type III pantothenate kinase [Bacteroidota bacterium]
MPIHLSIDLGNSSFKLSRFSGNKFISQKKFAVDDYDSVLVYCQKQKATAAILSSVVKHPKIFEKALRQIFPLLVFDHRTPLPFANKYGSPQTLGYDRLAAAAGGWQLFPGFNVLVIEAGTCIKYDVISKKNEYLGGAIAPGLQMRFAALHHFTQKLPLVGKTAKTPLLGRTTEESIRSGVQQAVLAETAGMIGAYRKQFPGLKIVLGGGDSAFFAGRLKTRIFVRPNIVAEGMHVILKYNVEKGFLEI